MTSYSVITGDCLTTLKNMPDETINCCVTSPPYFGLRDYGHDGQIGLEESPEKFVEKMIEVFREVKRVLTDDGTLWLNIGDTYNGYNGNRGRGPGLNKNNHSAMPSLPTGSGLTTSSVKNKELIGIPWRLALALQSDGWYLRQDIIWHKPNPMPESVRDRCTKAHEYIFLLTKSPRYYFDSDAIREPVKSTKGNAKSFRGGGSYTGGNSFNNHSEKDRETHGNQPNQDGKRNKRSVWTISTKPYKGAHFATFPPDLIEPCILSGCPSGGIVLDPFGGSGTTAGVAVKNGRNAILCELNPDYVQLIDKRVKSIVDKS